MESIIFLFLLVTAFISAAPIEELQVTPYVLELTRDVGRSLGRRQTAPLDGRTRVNYLANVTFGGHQTFELLVDTGSSDTWVIQDGYACQNPTDAPTCVFGQTYKTPGTFQKIPGVMLNVLYLDGTYIRGSLGNDSVTLAGVTVKNQVVGLADEVSITNGDKLTSGIVGLGLPAGTSAITSNDRPWLYDPIIARMIKDNLIKKPIFSLALDASDGKLGLGGLPDGVSYEDEWASAPLLPETIRGVSEIRSYNISIDGYVFDNAGKFSSTPYAVIDSGTTFSFLPSNIAAAVNGLFNPPAKRLNSGEFVIDCQANVPSFGVQIDGEKFMHKPEDMIVQAPDGTCLTTIGDNGDEPFALLGDSFMRRVLVVYDLGTSPQLLFARRT